MIKSLKQVGFVNVEMQAATFSHCAFPKPLASVVNWGTRPLLKALSHLGWLVAFWAEKS
jgi:hypothetical protein